VRGFLKECHTSKLAGVVEFAYGKSADGSVRRRVPPKSAAPAGSPASVRQDSKWIMACRGPFSARIQRPDVLQAKVAAALQGIGDLLWSQLGLTRKVDAVVLVDQIPSGSSGGIGLFFRGGAFSAWCEPSVDRNEAAVARHIGMKSDRFMVMESGLRGNSSVQPSRESSGCKPEWH